MTSEEYLYRLHYYSHKKEIGRAKDPGMSFPQGMQPLIQSYDQGGLRWIEMDPILRDFSGGVWIP